MSTDTPSAASKPLLPWLVAVLVAGVLAGIALAQTSPVRKALLGRNATPPQTAPPPLLPPQPPSPPPTPPIDEPAASTSTPLASVEPAPKTDKRDLSLTVDWLDQAQPAAIEVVTQHLASYSQQPNVEHDVTKYFPADGQYYYKLDPSNLSAGFWRKGTIKGGPLAGWGVYLRRVTEEGMMSFPLNSYILVSEDKTSALLLSSLTQPLSIGWDTAFLTFAPNMRFANSGTLPAQITLINGKPLYRGDIGLFWRGDCSSKECNNAVYQVTSKEGMRLYDEKSVSSGQPFFTGKGCLAAFADDGTQAVYTSYIPPNTTSTRGDAGVKKPAILWDAPWDTNNTFLSYTLSGCGAHGCTDIVTNDQVGQMSGLVQAGTTQAGEPVYVPKDPKNHPEIQQVYENWMEYNQQGEKPSLAAFLKKYKVPLFFWKDGFDRWVRYTNDIAIPVAECGKPVIYLYPEQTTNVNVQLPPSVRVTVSEPSYPRQGWNVSADPSGRLTMKDGSQFGSLFWEGTGVAYETPREGFLVKDGNVDLFLQSTLAKYGLNEQESAEFRAFWVPRMTGAPYYRVSFLTDAWNKAAPLLVTPKPTTSIRLFMDWRKLSAPVSIQEPTIITPLRKGFTLVEWGGTLWK